mmetsp:Transcript_15717/g.37508  ORF Transcript_15717/g.37508 Transcript_15717/m.37508 type:complete len:239 (-) Transcript_15717:16-732(-)
MVLFIGTLQSPVEQLIVPPCHVKVHESAPRLVDAKGARQDRIHLVRVAIKRLGEDYLLPLEPATNRVGVAAHGPSGFPPDEEDLAEVMDQSGKVQPALLGVAGTSALRCLVAVEQIVVLEVRVRGVKEVESLDDFRDGPLGLGLVAPQSIKATVLGLLPTHVIQRHLLVLLPVVVVDPLARGVSLHQLVGPVLLPWPARLFHTRRCASRAKAGHFSASDETTRIPRQLCREEKQKQGD